MMKNALKDKHVVVAVLVAPVLAVLAWYALDTLVGEQPQPAVEGASYPLVETPKCRYSSGRCGLENGDFELTLTAAENLQGRLTLTMTSAFPLEGAGIALVEGEDDDATPTAMRPTSADGLSWSVDIDRPDPGRQRLRLAVSSDGTLYYGDVSTAFTESEATGGDN
jgi:hypothetical protein